jgi:AdoMet-dependent heme synthase
LAGDGYCFISYRGDITPCGYFPLPPATYANSRSARYTGTRICSDLCANLAGYGGKCGACEFLRVCGGCRARAYSLTGDYLAEEPYCIYQPRKMAEVKV